MQAILSNVINATKQGIVFTTSTTGRGELNAHPDHKKSFPELERFFNRILQSRDECDLKVENIEVIEYTINHSHICVCLETPNTQDAKIYVLQFPTREYAAETA